MPNFARMSTAELRALPFCGVAGLRRLVLYVAYLRESAERAVKDVQRFRRVLQRSADGVSNVTESASDKAFGSPFSGRGEGKREHREVDAGMKSQIRRDALTEQHRAQWSEQVDSGRGRGSDRAPRPRVHLEKKETSVTIANEIGACKSGPLKLREHSQRRGDKRWLVDR